MPINNNYIGVEQSITIEQVDFLDTIINNTNDDLARIENNLLTEQSTRFTNDQTLQNQINTKLNEANSVFKADYTKYVVDGRDNIQEVINSITNQATVVYLSSGSIGGSGLVINKQSIALIAPITYPPSLEILQETTTAITADRIKFSNIQIDGVMNAGSSRSVYTKCDFMENVNILASADAGYMTFESCGFATNKTINVANNFASVIYFINCNFIGCSFSLNQATNQQVIFSNCAGFVSFPTNAFYAGINTLTSGYIQNTITKTILTAGAGELGQILTSGGMNGADTWTTPSGGGGSSDIIKERFSRYTLGQTVTTSRGNITLPNVTTELQNTGAILSWIELTGSNINYTPPVNTSIVEFEFSFYVYSIGKAISGIALQFYIDNVAQTITRAKQPLVNGGTSTFGQMRYNFKTTIEINGINDPTKCFVDTWNTSKNLKLRVSKLDNETMSFHRVTALVTDDPIVGTDTIIAPLLTITAY